MGHPQLIPGAGTGSQFGPRIFKGKTTYHIGRDQPVGVGTLWLAPAAGVVLDHGRTETYGHWIAVRFDGARNAVRMHQVQAGSRLPAGRRFTTGTPLAAVGHPHLWLTEAARRGRADWSGGSKASSTGAHAHEQHERDRVGGTPIDPAGAEASADWDRVSAAQNRPAATVAAPLIQEDDMPIIYIIQKGTVYAFETATSKKRRLGPDEWATVRNAYTAAGRKVPVAEWGK